MIVTGKEMVIAAGYYNNTNAVQNACYWTNAVLVSLTNGLGNIYVSAVNSVIIDPSNNIIAGWLL